jgi:D-beta-D-heptose 7-phosphate kinase/D-beta-D-heptose 1-phosphate adenosyltransferase
MKTKKVLVIGDVMIDHYINGKCHRISPEAPVPVVDFISEEFKLGGAANLANNIASLNGNVSILSIVGNDKSAKKIHELLEQFRINDIIIDSIERETTIKTRVMVDGHQIVRIDRENPEKLDEKDEINFLNKISEVIPHHEIILLSDYNKGTLTTTITKKIIDLCNCQNKKVFIDPKSNDFNKYFNCTLIKPNLKEAELASGIKITDNKSLEMACREITKITNCKILLITMSEKGVCLFEKNEMTILPAHAKEVLDVTGAGDTFLAAFCKETLLEKSILNACEYANMVSAIAILKLGSSVVTENEIQVFKSNLNDNLDIY